MCKELSLVDWKCIFEGKTVNDNWTFFRDKLREYMDENIPVKSQKSNGVTHKTIKPVWMTQQALKAVRKKHKLWSKYQKSRDNKHFLDFCKVRNKATSECRKARMDFEGKIAEEENPKSFYKCVNSRRKVNMGISELKDVNGESSANELDKAEILNKFFKKVFTVEDVTNVLQLNDKSNGSSVSDFDISESCILKILENLNVKKPVIQTSCTHEY